MKIELTDEHVAQAAREFVHARRDKLAAKRLRGSFKCREEERDDPETGYGGTAPCYYDPSNGLCEECEKRAAAHAEVKRLEPIAAKALRNLIKLFPVS